jgi:hypothetical protein
MDTYTIIKKGSNINHCIPIPIEFNDMDLEITIKPVRKGSECRKKSRNFLKKTRTPTLSARYPIRWNGKERQEVTGNKALFDSNIIIYLAKREIPLSFLDQFDDLCISVISYMEILGFSFSNQEEEKYLRDLSFSLGLMP